MSEFIGSRISLISKSDIKYIGTLHEINSDSHTVALENVRSYGTEGRKGNPAEEIDPSDQVYEYIVFRGSDVKELQIVEPPGPQKPQQAVPDDPAILGSARPPPQQQQPPPPQTQQPPPPQNQNQFRGPPPPPHQYPQHPQPPPHFGYQGPPPNQYQGQPRFQGPGGAHGFPGSPGAVPGYGGYPPPPPPGYGFNGPPPPDHGFPPHFPPGQGPPHQQFGSPGPQQMNQQRGPPPQQMQGQQQQGPIGSNSSTPQPPQNLGPPQQPSKQSDKPVEMSATPGPSAESQAGPPPPTASKPSTAAATAPPAAPQQPAQKPKTGPQRATNNRVAVPLPTQPKSAAAPQPRPAAPPQSFADATQAATAAVAAAMAKLGPGRPQQQTDGATDNLTQKVQQMRIQDQQQRGGSTRGPRSRGGAPRGGMSRGKPIDVPKEDFDFESSNAKFNKQEMVKEAIATGSPAGEPSDPIASSPATNGHANNDEDVVIPPAEKGYDKKSSFFDNISSDLKDRTEQAQSDVGFDGRAMRAQERTKNMDTFGQSNIEGGGYRGGYRGRGRGFNNNNNYRGRGGGYRGKAGYAGMEARGGPRTGPRDGQTGNIAQ